MMKRAAVLLALVLFLSAFACARADELPPEVRAYLYDDMNACETFELPGGGGFIVVLTAGGRLIGFEESGGAYVMAFDLSPMGYGGAILQRHESGGDQGAVVPGFDVMDENGVSSLSFAWDGEGFAVCGWRSDAWQASLKGDVISYVSADGSVREDCALASQMRVWLIEYGYVPHTPDEARALIMVSPETAETLAPGFTLCSYESYNVGALAEAGYARVTDDGRLQICRAVLEAGTGVTHTTTSMAVPLSPELLARTKTEPFCELFGTDVYSDTFVTEHPVDTALIPVTGSVVQSDLQACGLILLTREADGTRSLSFVTENRSGGYSVETLRGLPADLSMDVFHSGERELSLEWCAAPEQYVQIGYELSSDWRWRFLWGMMPDGNYSAEYGKITYWSDEYDELRAVGTLPFGDLFADGIDDVPVSVAGAAASVRRDGWAVVNNADPTDRLHLRAQPDRGAASLGKFWNGTVLNVLETRGDWARVRVGADTQDALEGWMMRRYLAMGEDMDAVEPAPAQMMLKEELETPLPVYTDLALKKKSPLMTLDGSETIIGVVEADGKQAALYIVINPFGQAGYVPQDWYWPGNG